MALNQKKKGEVEERTKRQDWATAIWGQEEDLDSHIQGAS
jgi:hypothetical protein